LGSPDGEHDEMTRATRAIRAFNRFREHPTSLRYASAAIISTMVALIVLGAVLMRIFVNEQYRTFGDALWFTLQTVTTVGYGDNPPRSGVGQLVASVVMLVSIGLVAVITAAVTSMFIRAVSRDEQESDLRTLTDSLSRIEARLAEADERLDRIERATTMPDSDRNG
jgi:voltage-gated potassium channel Kch